MIPYWKPEFEAILLEVANHKLDLRYVDELQSFYDRHEKKEDAKAINFACQLLISTIYSYHKLDEKSLAIDLKLMKEYSFYYSGYDAVIGRAGTTSERLGRIDEVMYYAIPFLKTPADNLNQKLYTLAWYVRLRPDGENGSFDSFEHNLIPFEAMVGMKPDRSIPFADRIILVQNELNRADHHYDEFYFAFKDASKEERVKLVEHYLVTEHLEHYKDRMKRFS